MEAGYLTPFLDMLKHGQTDREIRLMAAQGSLGLRSEEQRGVLDLLVGDPDPEVARTAAASIAAGAATPEPPLEPDEEKEESFARTVEEKASVEKGILEKLAAMNPA